MSVSDDFTGLLQRTSDSFIRDNVHMVDKSMLARALKTIEPQYQDKIFSNMTEDGAAELKRIIGNLGTISLQEVESAQREIMYLASQV